MNTKKIRWKERFVNFQRAFLLLSESVERFETLDDLSKEGLVQRFEYTFELAWKTLKDYLEAEGVMTKFPRETIKEAFRGNLINNGEAWMEMLEKRNLLAHTYDERNFKEALQRINGKYYPEINALYQRLKDEQ